MKLITLIQAGALLMLAVMGAYASNSDAPVCNAAQSHEACEL